MYRRVFDTHCDTLYKWNQNNLDTEFSFADASLYKRFIQVMAIWVDSETIKEPFQYAEHVISLFKEHAPHIPIMKSVKDISGKGTSVILGVEGGEAMEGSIEKLRMLFDLGVRLITLVWNWQNELCDCAMRPKPDGGGLTEFGRSAVAEMERLSMAVDVSHLSDKGFWDVIEISKKPIIASHSCSRALHNAKRNLSDDQFKAIIYNGGVVGVNFSPDFLGGNEIEDVVKHILHFAALGGENHVGLGSDFDGLDSLPNGLERAAFIYKIADLMLRMNIKEELVDKFMYGNMERYFQMVLPQK